MCPLECFSHLTSVYPITPDAHRFGCFLIDSHTMKFHFFLFIFTKILARRSEGGAQSNTVKVETPFPPSVSAAYWL